MHPSNDDDFPDRPDHPHFGRLVALANDLDQGHGETMGHITEQGPMPGIDLVSLAYFTKHRAMFAVREALGPGVAEEHKVQAAWLEGFMFGRIYEHRWPAPELDSLQPPPDEGTT